MFDTSYGKTWGSVESSYNYDKLDIDRQNALNSYTDFEFSNTDKVLGTVAGVEKAIVKDYDSLTSGADVFADSIKKGAIVLITLIVISTVLGIYGKVRKWSF